MPGKHSAISRKVARCARKVAGKVANPWAVCNAAIRGRKRGKAKK